MTVKKKEVISKSTKTSHKKSEVNRDNMRNDTNNAINSEDKNVENYGESSYGMEERVLDSNEVYDDADIASTIEMNFIAQALEKHREKVAAETHPDFDGETCVECGEEIPEARLKLKKIRCVDCQSELELRNKLYGR